MFASLARAMSSAPVTVSLKRTRALMLQLPVGADKQANLSHAKRELADALAESRADLVVLPEVWQSPYGVQHFGTYAESFGGLWDTLQQRAGKEAHGRARWGIDGRSGGVPLGAECASETLRWLSEQAREHGVVLVGGSIPERDEATGKLYNTSSVFDEQGASGVWHERRGTDPARRPPHLALPQGAPLRHQRARHVVPGEQDPECRRPRVCL
jgi:hypothetical protein